MFILPGLKTEKRVRIHIVFFILCYTCTVVLDNSTGLHTVCMGACFRLHILTFFFPVKPLTLCKVDDIMHQH